MKATGIVRVLDGLGRVVLPMELRRTFGIAEGDRLEVFMNGRDITIRQYTEGTGIVRAVDGLGRFVLPVEIRRTLDLSEGASVEIFVDGKDIVLRKYTPGCAICDEIADNYTRVNGKNICPSCVSTIKSAG